MIKRGEKINFYKKLAKDDNKKNKKGVSPVISTILLITMVIILAGIIFLWARGFIGEAIEKEVLGEKKPIESFCDDVSFRASIEGNELFLVNRGNVPIYEINVKQQKPGTSKIKNYIVELGGGSSKNGSISIDTDTESVVIIPVLLGETSEKQTSKFTCPESIGVEIEL